MEYRIDNTSKVVFFILAAFCILIGGGLLVYSFGAGGRTAEGVCGIFIAGIGVLVMLHSRRLRLTIDDQSLTMTTLFSSRTIQLGDIDGYRRGPKNQLYIIHKDGGRRLVIAQALGKRKELIEWLDSKYGDVDLRKRKKELDNFLENEAFGVTKEDRQARLESAKKIEKAGTVIGSGLLLWVLFFPRPYELVMILLFVMPWVAIGVTWYYKGLMRLNKRRSSPYPSLILLLFLSTLGALIATIRDYNLYRFEKWSLPAGGSVVVMVVAVVLCWQAIVASGKKVLAYITLLVMACLYSWSLLIFSNCYYDRSEPEVSRVAVTGKRVTHGRSASYYLTLSPWGPYEKEKEITVGSSFYKQVNEQDSLTIFSKAGKWGQGWFWVEK